MNKEKVSKRLSSALRILIGIGIAAFALLAVYVAGYLHGYVGGREGINDIITRQVDRFASASGEEAVPTPTPTVIYRTPTPVAAPPVTANFSGPELWDVVNSRRVQNGVGELSAVDEICTIASLRLNELLARGELDGHEGFHTLPERREELQWIYDKYNLSEFLLSGAESAEDAASLWENTLGHSKTFDRRRICVGVHLRPKFFCSSNSRFLSKQPVFSQVFFDILLSFKITSDRHH